MRLGNRPVIEAGRRLGRQIVRDEVDLLASALAFRFFLSLFPFFIFVAALSGFVAATFDLRDPTQQMVDLLGGVSNQITEPVQDELAAILETRQPGILSLGIVGTFWVATTGMSAIIMAMNRAYQVEETRPFWKRYLLALGLTLLAGVALAGAFVLLVVGEFLGRQIAGALGLQTVYQVAVTLARWPVAIVLLLLAMAFLYRAAPNVDLPWKWVAPGAVVFTAGWVLVTVLLSVYIANFGSYNATYGTLGGVVALLIWFYLTGFILLLGAELNAFLDEQADRLGLDEQRRQMRAQAPPEHGDTARGEDGQLAA